MLINVAKAIEPAAWSDDWEMFFFTEEERNACRAFGMKKARASIEALMEPSKAMISAGIKAADGAIQPVISQWYQEEAGYEAEDLFASLAAPASYQAMLRAALGDG